jgi:hypothetical protein
VGQEQRKCQDVVRKAKQKANVTTYSCQMKKTSYHYDRYPRTRPTKAVADAGGLRSKTRSDDPVGQDNSPRSIRYTVSHSNCHNSDLSTTTKVMRSVVAEAAPVNAVTAVNPASNPPSAEVPGSECLFWPLQALANYLCLVFLSALVAARKIATMVSPGGTRLIENKSQKKKVHPPPDTSDTA